MREFVDLRGPGPASARARAMSSRYCRQLEYDPYPEVTNASARVTPAAAMSDTAPVR